LWTIGTNLDDALCDMPKRTASPGLDSRMWRLPTLRAASSAAFVSSRASAALPFRVPL